MAQMDDFDDLDDLGSLDDFEDLDDLEGLTLEDDPPAPQAPAAAPQPAAPQPAAPIAAPPPAAPQPAAAAPLSGLGTVIQDLMAKRNFAQVVQIASSQKDAIAQDPQALAMVETAQRQLEADNYVQSFLQAAGAARDRGDVQGMQEQLEKARALDPQHPAVAAFSTAVPQQSAAPPQAAAPIAAPPPAVPQPAAPPPATPQPAAPIAAPPPAAPTSAAPPSAEDDFLSFDDDAPLELGTPAAAPPAAAPAPDLADDLSLEEPLDDAPLDMSFEEPAAPAAAAPPVPEAPPAAADPGNEEGGDRIQQLLTEGQGQFDQGDYQGAIDMWSRIFLIDIDNSEASRLIEEARGKKAELERQAEELFHQASDHVEQRQMEEAKAAFRQVLEIDPSHSLAQEYLDQLEAGEFPVLNRGGDAEILTPPEDGEGFAGEGEGEQSMEAAVQRDRIVVTKKMDRRLIALGALVAIVLIGGGVFLAMNWNDLPPNQQDVATAPAMKTDPIEKATKLHEEGKTDAAIRVLELIPESNPVYQDANALVAQWRAEAEAPPEDIDTGPSEEQLARRQLLLGAARQAHGEGLHLRARKYFDAAANIAPLEGDDAALFNVGRDALASLSKEIGLFEEAEYERLIPDLWRRYEREPENADVELLLVDSYYNLALTDLQRGDALGAAEKLKDALTVQPDNRELQRLELFAKTYSSRSADLLYRIYVKYLPSRS